ncbi:LysM peptidoglycan-binding domain-containing protein [Algoriphagus litoralis]|uniref:LysM peptidoglycan-binding domain-containing protein n=1 Tax=Algoriphagus litoralis TaxID=2202829 RepID=UPI000DB9657E|nr:LysM peptidoglycan-binding domain-containing protein [Algoriphagus litoralis]
MIFKHRFISTLFLIFSLSSSISLASELIAGDSIGVERVGDKTYILHKVSPQETLFAISRRYQVPVGEIQNSNEVLKQGLKIGQTIRVPYFAKSDLAPGSMLHKVAPGETLFSISKKYSVSVDSLKQWNKLLGNDLSIGQALIVKETTPENPVTAAQPIAIATTSSPVTTSKSTSVVEEIKPKPEPKPAEKKTESVQPKKSLPEPVAVKNVSTEPTKPTSAPVAPGEWISHTVAAGETLFSLSTKYESSVEDLIKWNGLTSNNLRSGQVIKVGRAPEAPVTVPVIGTPSVATSTTEMYTDETPENTSGGFKNIKENGQAELIEGTGGHKKYLVLHRDAPVGSIMRVKNEENDITIFARVVGKLPETGDNSKLVIKLSQAAFDQLRAVNQRFPVEVLY